MDKVKKVLIIDDDPIILDAYSIILNSMGHKVAVARDGQEGLEQAKKFKPDLILLDILMPIVDGVEFLKQFKPKAHPETKVLVLSNSPAGGKLHQALELGAIKCLIKTDIKPERVKAEVGQLLST